MQKIFLLGNLVKDAETFSSKEGKEMMSFTVAVNDKDKEATFYDCVAGKYGIFEYLKKGQCLAVTGALKIKKNEKEGKTYTNISVWAEDIALAAGKQAKEG